MENGVRRLRPDPVLRRMSLRSGGCCWRSKASRSPTAPSAPSATSRSTSGPGRCTRSAGTTAPARAPSSRRSSASSGRTPGVIRFDGVELALRNPQDAQAHGIALVNQELSLVPELSVEDNIFLGGIGVPLLYRRRRLSEQARGVLDESRPPSRPARHRRRVALDRRAAARRDRSPPRPRRPPADPRRADRDAEQAGDRAGLQGDARPRAQGRSVIFVSHRLDEVFELCDRVTVLRDGMRVGTHDIREIDRRSLIDHMLGEMEGAKDGGGARARPSRLGGRGGEDRPAARSRARRGAVAHARERDHHRARRAGRDPARARCFARSAASSRTRPARSRFAASASPQHAAAGGRRGRPLHPERPPARGPVPRAVGRAQPDGHAAPPVEPGSVCSCGGRIRRAARTSRR